MRDREGIQIQQYKLPGGEVDMLFYQRDEQEEMDLFIFFSSERNQVPSSKETGEGREIHCEINVMTHIMQPHSTTDDVCAGSSVYPDVVFVISKFDTAGLLH